VFSNVDFHDILELNRVVGVIIGRNYQFDNVSLGMAMTFLIQNEDIRLL